MTYSPKFQLVVAMACCVARVLAQPVYESHEHEQEGFSHEGFDQGLPQDEGLTLQDYQHQADDYHHDIDYYPLRFAGTSEYMAEDNLSISSDQAEAPVHADFPARRNGPRKLTEIVDYTDDV